MCSLLTKGQGLRLLQSTPAAQQPTTLLGPLGVLLHALPERVLQAHDENGGANDRSQ